MSKGNFTIIPSKFDALNRVGVESLMNGVPLLISNNTGLTLELADRVECFKFKPDIQAIVALLEKVELNKEKQFEMSKNARNTFLKRFSMNKYCNEFSKIILRAIE